MMRTSKPLYALFSVVFLFSIIIFILTNISRYDRNILPLPTSRQPSKHPNIVFILTDDQDLQMDSLLYMPFVQKHLIDRGTSYRRHYCTVAICCPSRVTLWTGKAAHNTNVTDVNPPYGGYPKFISQGLNDLYLPVWLQESGYNTYYTGKLFNAHTIRNYDSPHAKGFNGSEFILDPHTYEYLGARFQRNHDAPVSYEGYYSTDVVAEKSFGFLEDAQKSERPFFLAIAPIAPHFNIKIDGGRAVLTAPVAAERHEGMFKNAKVPRTANFNPEKASGVSWIRSLPRQDEQTVDYNDEYYRARLQSLQPVDEMVDELVKRLEGYGVLDDTFIIFTTDNGYHIGQHRLQPGKECGYEEDVNIPLVIRGPNVPENIATDIVTTHTDIAPTVFELIGRAPRSDFDGTAIPLTKAGLDQARESRYEHVNVEYWGFNMPEGKFGREFYWNNTYKALRIVGKGYNLYYSVWCNNEHELYDMTADPGQLNNLYSDDLSSASSLLDLHISKVVARLDALLLVLKSCKDISCIRPWDSLHEDGNVKDLWDALDTRYDSFYEEEQRKVSFSRCEPGYIIDAEGPQEALTYRGTNKVSWSEFV